MTYRWMGWFVTLITAGMMACGGGTGNRQGVSNPGDVQDKVPAMTRETVPELVELCRIIQNPAWDDEAAITEVEPISGPNLYLVDTRLKRVFVVDPEGSLLYRFLKKGQGPGEFQYYLRFQRLGDDLWVSEYQKLGRFSLDGVLQEESRFKTSYQYLTMVDGDRFVGVRYAVVGDAKTGKRIKRAGMWDRREVERRVYRDSEKRGVFEFHLEGAYITVGFGGGIVPDLITATDAGRGLVYICETDRYRIDVVDLEGNPVRTIERDISGVPFSDEDKQALVDNFRISGVDQSTLKSELRKQLPDVMQPVGAMFVTLDGWLVVERPVRRGKGVLDLYDPTGTLRASWKSPEDVDLGEATFFEHDRIGLVDDSGEFPVVVMYRIQQ